MTFNSLILAVLFFLSACSNLGNLSNLSAPTSINTAPRQYHQQIDMVGRLSAQYEQNNQPQAIHINFTWSQSPQQTTITLTSPTGQTLATLLINAQGAQLNQAKKPPQFASDADQLLLTMLGWPLPVADLRYWLQGFLSADQPAMSSAHAESTYILVDGWNLMYPTWATENHHERPKRLDLMRQTEQAGLVSLRIVIDEWNGQ